MLVGPGRTDRYAMPWPHQTSKPDGAEMINEIGRVAGYNGTKHASSVTAFERSLDDLELGLPPDPWTPFEPVWRASNGLSLDYDLDGSGVLDCTYVRYAFTTMIMRFDYTFSSTSADAVALSEGALTWSLPALGRRTTFRGNKLLPGKQTSILSGRLIGHGYMKLGSSYHLCFARFAFALDRVSLWRVDATDPAQVVTGAEGFSSGDRVAFQVDYETASRST